MTNSDFVIRCLGIVVLIGSTCLFQASCMRHAEPSVHRFSGATMGTTYAVKIVLQPGEELARQVVSRAVEDILDQVNQSMSHWIESSDVCRFNRHRDTSQPLRVSPDTVKVIERAIQIARWSNGAFDPTIGPLIERWGFGTSSRKTMPTPQEISVLLDQIGYDKLILKGDTLFKQHPELSLNLSAIAKGYAVDKLAETLLDMQLTDFMVEIGGEVRTSGLNEQRTRWRIGIESPDVSPTQRRLFCVAQLSGWAIATSGDYRNFFVHEDRRLGHIIDPHTGHPVLSDVASVSVIAKDCLTADALATAFSVMAVDTSLELVQDLPNVECMILRHAQTGDLIPEMSNGMADFVQL